MTTEDSDDGYSDESSEESYDSGNDDETFDSISISRGEVTTDSLTNDEELYVSVSVEESTAATLLQSKARQTQARKDVDTKRAQSKAAVSIQCQTRKAKAKKQVRESKTAAIKLQNRARQQKAEKTLRESKQAARTLQSKARQRQASVKVADIRTQKKPVKDFVHGVVECALLRQMYAWGAQRQADRTRESERCRANLKRDRRDSAATRLGFREDESPALTTVWEAVAQDCLDVLIKLNEDTLIGMCDFTDQPLTFQKLVSAAEGVVVASDHPYEQNTDQSLKIHVNGAKGIGIVFDVRSDSRPGSGRIEFFDEATSVKVGCQSYSPQGINEYTSTAKKPEEEETGDNGDQTADYTSPRSVEQEDVPSTDLPGVCGVPPLFIPSNGLLIRFAAGEFGGTVESEEEPFGWRLIAYSADNSTQCREMFNSAMENARRSIIIDQVNDLGMTMLHMAAWNGSLECAEYLIEQGANVDSSSPGNSWCTPLHVAARSGHYKIVKLLIDANSSIYAENAEGDLPLHLACKRSVALSIRYLLAADDSMQSIVKKNSYGKVPKDLLRRSQGSLHEVMAEAEKKLPGRSKLPKRRVKRGQRARISVASSRKERRPI